MNVIVPMPAGANRRAELKGVRHAAKPAVFVDLPHLLVDGIGHSVAPIDILFTVEHQHVPEIRRPLHTWQNDRRRKRFCLYNAAVGIVVG